MTALFSDSIELLPPGSSSAIYKWAAIESDLADTALHELLTTVAWSQPLVRMYGRESMLPRLVAWVADSSVEYSYSGLSTGPQPWTPLLRQLLNVAETYSSAPFNSVLLNAYLDGNHKVSWHSDDEPIFGKRPTIASLSLGAERRFKLRHRDTRQIIEQRLGHGSLLVMSGDCQRDWEHELPKEAGVSSPRVNLTFRLVATPGIQTQDEDNG